MEIFKHEKMTHWVYLLIIYTKVDFLVGQKISAITVEKVGKKLAYISRRMTVIANDIDNRPPPNLIDRK